MSKRAAKPAEGVTGRGSYIIAEAPMYAIVAIDMLPENRRRYSNQHDMKRIRDRRDPPILAALTDEVRQRMQLINPGTGATQ